MPTNPAPPQSEATPVPTVTAPPAPDTALAALTERERIRAIMNLPEAKDRQKQAQTIALDTVLDPATAQKVLAAAPVEAAPAPKGESSFERMMNSLPVPNVGAAGAEAVDADSPAAEAARVLAWVPDKRKMRQIA